MRATQYVAGTAWQRFLPEGPLGILPLSDGRVSVVWSTTPDKARAASEADDDALGRMLTEASDHVLGRLQVAGPRGSFPLAAQHARQYVLPGVALIGDAATRTVRAYRSDGRRFEAGSDPTSISANGDTWQVEEAALIGPDGRLERLPGHIAYWFAWQAFIDGAPLATR